MERNIKIDNQKIVYKIRKSRRAKRVRLAVYHDASVVITLPILVREKEAEKFLRQKADWLVQKINHFQKHKNNKLTLLDKKDYIDNKEKALQIVNNIITKYNKNNEFQYNKIKIKNQKSRWGSCSNKGNININYKIIYLSQRVAEYIIVHELCHLKELNHSRKFWEHVAYFVPDYLEIRKELKSDGLYC